MVVQLYPFAHLMPGIFTFFIAMMMFSFAGYHLWLVARNTTTNETFKWSDARAFQEYCRQVIDNPDLVDKKTRKRPEITKEVREWSKIKIFNVYNRGWRLNFQEVFFPHSWHLKDKKNR